MSPSSTATTSSCSLSQRSTSLSRTRSGPALDWAAHLAAVDEQSRGATLKIGSLLLSVWYAGDEQSNGGVRRRYGYRIEDLDSTDSEPYRAHDLLSRHGAEIDVMSAMRSLVSFLAAAGESYQYRLGHPGSMPENLLMFPEWLTEAAYRAADQVAFLVLPEDDEDGSDLADASPSMLDDKVRQTTPEQSTLVDVGSESETGFHDQFGNAVHVRHPAPSTTHTHATTASAPRSRQPPLPNRNHAPSVAPKPRPSRNVDRKGPAL